jgi:hypothetical protein
MVAGSISLAISLVSLADRCKTGLQSAFSYAVLSPGDGALFLPFGRNKRRQEPASCDTRAKAKIRRLERIRGLVQCLTPDVTVGLHHLRRDVAPAALNDRVGESLLSERGDGRVPAIVEAHVRQTGRLLWHRDSEVHPRHQVLLADRAWRRRGHRDQVSRDRFVGAGRREQRRVAPRVHGQQG